MDRKEDNNLRRELRREQKLEKKRIKKWKKSQRYSMAPLIPMAILICLLISLFAFKSELFGVEDPPLYRVFGELMEAPNITIDRSAAEAEEQREQESYVIESVEDNASAGETSYESGEETSWE